MHCTSTVDNSAMDSPSTDKPKPLKRRLLAYFHEAAVQESAKNESSPESASTASSSGHNTDESEGSKLEDGASTHVLSGTGAAEALLTLIKTPGTMKLRDGREMTVTKVSSAEDIVQKLKAEEAFIDNVIHPQDTQTRDGMMVIYAKSLGLESKYDFTCPSNRHDSVLRLVSDTSGPDVIFNVRVEESNDDEPAARLIFKGKWPFVFP